MPNIVKKLFVLLALVAAVAVGAKLVSSTRINGDGGEYLMMTHGFAHHGSPVLDRAAFVEFLNTPTMSFQKEFHDEVLRVLEHPTPRSYAGYTTLDGKEVHAIHFWSYSLLAVPFFWLLKLMGANPAGALTLLNISLLGLTALYLWRYWTRGWAWSLVVFLLAGTTFYLRFTGPEVLTACALLVATLAIFRSQTGLAILVSGIAASQNPSLVFVIPLAVAARLPAWRSAITPANLAMAASGVVLALAPYAYFMAQLGVPSIPGKFFADAGNISLGRLLSLALDLDQGMVIAIPGVLLALVIAYVSRRQAGEGKAAAIAMLIFLVCALPTLAATNWNSGGVVVARYAYWLGAPFVALLIYMLHGREQHRMPALAACLAVQVLVLWHFGVVGSKASHTQHTAMASFALDRLPGSYHPDPEIFLERGLGHEASAPLDHILSHLHLVAGKPAKLLVAEGAPGAAVHCPPGQLLSGAHRVAVGRGWEYQHAPFSCIGKEAMEELAFGGKGSANAMLGAGWSTLEPTGVWTDGPEARIELVPTGTATVASLRFSGFYAGGGTARTEVEVNGRVLGMFDLANELVPVPAVQRMTVVLRHPGVTSPSSRGESADTRRLGFYLRSLTLNKR